MGCEPVEFFAHIGLSGDQHRFLVQPVRIETIGCFQQSRDLIGYAFLYGVGSARRGRLGAPDKSCNFTKPARQNATKSKALLPPVFDQVRHNPAEPPPDPTSPAPPPALRPPATDPPVDPFDAEDPSDPRPF